MYSHCWIKIPESDNLFYRKSPKIYLFDLAGYSTGKFDSQLLRFLKGSWEATQIGQRIHADQSRCLFIHGLKTRMKRLSFICVGTQWKR